MKRLITPPVESNEATRQPAPTEDIADTVTDSKRSYTPDTEAEPMTPAQLAERYRRRKGHAAKLRDLTLSEEDMQKLLGQSDDEGSVGTQEQVNPSSIPEAAKAEDVHADSRLQEVAGDSKRSLSSRRELREQERAVKNDKSITGIGKRALGALSDAAKSVREDVEAFHHRGMQLVDTEHHGKIWVQARTGTTHTSRHTPILHR